MVRPELEKAIIDSVRQVTHIAKPESGAIDGIPLSSEGVFHDSIAGLCSEFTTAKSRWGAFTTEMYPDSPRFKAHDAGRVEAICCETQVACIRGALEYWIKTIR